MFSYLFHQKVTLQLWQALLPKAPSAGWMKPAEDPRGPSQPCPEAGLAQALPLEPPTCIPDQASSATSTGTHSPSPSAEQALGS